MMEMAKQVTLDIDSNLPLCYRTCSQDKKFVIRDNLVLSKIYCADEVLDRIDCILSVR